MNNNQSPIARFEGDDYFAVIFTSYLPLSDEAYGRTAERMKELAQSMPGFLGIESVRDANGHGITVSYWKDREAIANWKQHAEHRIAQSTGKSRWYGEFASRVCRVERASFFDRAGAAQSTPETKP